MNGLKILGMTDEGTCDHCGANCPKRRVSVMTSGGEVELWGVVCASKARGERGTASDAKILTQFARAVDEFRSVIVAGGGEAEIRAASRWGFPWEIRGGILSVWSGRGPREPDVKIPLVA